MLVTNGIGRNVPTFNLQENVRRTLDTDPSRSRPFLTGESGDDGSVSQKRAAAWDTVRTWRGLGRTLTNKHFAKVETLCLACKP